MESADLKVKGDAERLHLLLACLLPVLNHEAGSVADDGWTLGGGYHAADLSRPISRLVSRVESHSRDEGDNAVLWVEGSQVVHLLLEVPHLLLFFVRHLRQVLWKGDETLSTVRGCLKELILLEVDLLLLPTQRIGHQSKRYLESGLSDPIVSKTKSPNCLIVHKRVIASDHSSF